MEQIASLRSCLDNDGNFDPAKFAQYRNQRCQYFDEDEEEEVVVPKKRKFAHRHYEGYDPQSALCSEWYNSYVKYPEKQRTVTFHTLFRRRFRMPYKSYRDIVAEARNDDWFPSYEKCNALGQPGIPLDILILGALRYLGKGWTFDDLFESTGVSEEIHRKFLKNFTVACITYLYPKWVKRPETEAEIEDCMSEFKQTGFDGCIGSADITLIWHSSYDCVSQPCQLLSYRLLDN